MKVGLIGERNNYISYSMLQKSLACKDIKIIWFIDAKLPNSKKEKLYGEIFNYGPIIRGLRKIANFLNNSLNRSYIDCKKLCDSKNISYIIPKNLSINTGLPDKIYQNIDADYVLIVGCDQLLNDNGLKIARNKIINYHYGPLPAYRGKYAIFWQWYNRETYIGYSFHEVNLGVDSGEVIYQGKVSYSCDEPLHKVTRRVVSNSSNQVCKVYECLVNNNKVLLNEELKNSFYSSKKYLTFSIADRSKNVDEMLDLFKRVGSFKLKNGLVIKRIIQSNYKSIPNYEIDNEGIIIPLSNGYIKGTISSQIPFWVFRILLDNGLKNVVVVGDTALSLAPNTFKRKKYNKVIGINFGVAKGNPMWGHPDKFLRQMTLLIKYLLLQNYKIILLPVWKVMEAQ